MMRQLSAALILLVACWTVVGCGPKGANSAGQGADSHAQEQASAQDCKAFATQYAQLMMKRDFNGMRALGTQAYQVSHTMEQLQAGFDEKFNDLVTGEPNFKLTSYEIDNGSLPSSVKEAQDTYGIKDPPDQKTWRGWYFCVIGQGEKPTSVDKGFEARIFIVDEGGQLKVAYSEFAFPH
ncbi:MAG: hypothetical protein JSS72_10655 [Armatimonadetes bacterium]|nr:hypothetical protein [Armatimonadota bacterium]